MRRSPAAALLLAACAADLPPPALDPLPAQTGQLTIEVAGRAPGAVEVEVEVAGAEAALLAPVGADGRFRLTVPLLPDVRNRLRARGRTGGEVSPAAGAEVEQVLRDSIRLGDVTAPQAPELDPWPAAVGGSVLKISGRAEPGSLVWIASPVEEVQAPADPVTGRFSRDVAIRPGAESWILVGARDAAGNSSDPAIVQVVSETTAAEPPPPPVLEVAPLFSWRTAITLSGTAQGANRVRVEGGAVPAQGAVGPDGRFAVGVALVPGRENLLTIRAVTGELESEAVVWRLRQTGQGKTRWPVVLVPGLLGFPDVAGQDYFFRVQSQLEARGAEVSTAELPPVQSVARRALALREAIDRITSGKVNLVAHSTGGLDARFMIARLGMGNRVASLTTIGTPHRGVPVADVALRLLPGAAEVALDFLVNEAGYDPDGARELTVAHMTADFNPSTPDDPRVAYFSYGGAADPRGGERMERLEPLLWMPFAVIREYEGPNDGLVSAESARWGTWLGTVPADHLDQIGQVAGQTGRFDHHAFYARVAAELAARGY